MTLYINTILENKVKVALQSKQGELVIEKSGKLREGSKLLALIDKLLKDNKLSWKNIDTIKVADAGGSFSSLRVGVLLANALAYAYRKKLQGESAQETIKLKNFEVLSPIYSSEPNIGISKKTINI